MLNYITVSPVLFTQRSSEIEVKLTEGSELLHQDSKEVVDHDHKVVPQEHQELHEVTVLWVDKVGQVNLMDHQDKHQVK
jgi:hypothetical protein